LSNGAVAPKKGNPVKLNTQDNPATTIGGITLTSLTAAVAAVLIILRAFSIYDVSEDQYAAIIGAVAAFWFVIIPMAISIRGIAFAPSTVEDIKTTLAQADPNTPLTQAEAAAMAR
jgi:hypothetical protein